MTSIMEQNKKIKSVIKKIAAFAFWILVWQIISMIVQQEILIVSPAKVILRLSQLVLQGEFWLTAGTSILRIMLGFLEAVVIGTILAIITVKIPFAYDLFYPVLSIIKATPVASFIILALVWTGRDNVPTLMAMLMVLPIIWANVSDGINGTDKRLLEVAKVFNFSKAKTIKKVYIPSVLPLFVSGCTTGIGLAWKAGIAAEVISVPSNSIGTMLYNAKIYIETADLFAWTIVIIVLSVILEKLVVFLINKTYKKWGGPNDRA